MCLILTAIIGCDDLATIRDVAKRAGVSISTVSRVLNGHSMISDETKRQVFEAVEFLNYTPKPRGRHSQKASKKTILVLTTSPIAQITSGICDAAKQFGYDTMITVTQPSDASAYVKYVEEGIFSGIVLLNIRLMPEISEALLSICPIVQCNEYEYFPKANLVTIDNNEATRDITLHLIETGKKRLAFLSPQYYPGYQIKFASDREYGFKRALDEQGLDINNDLIVRIAYDPRNNESLIANINSVVVEMLSLPQDARPDGIVCTNDFIAACCINTAKKMGIRIPEELAVTSFDNSVNCLLTDPTITSIDQPYYEMGYESAKLLISVINEKPKVSKQVLLGHRLIKRGSSVPEN
jgi:LacI family repressor for deo operon, udp, cdd, tsx, nupC, and nupG